MKGTYQGYKQNGKFFNVTVDGSFVGFGMTHPEDNLGLQEGDVIEFETYQRGNFTNADTKTVRKVSDSDGSSNSKPAADNSKSRGSSGGMNKGEYWDKKEARDIERQTVIEHQSSRNAAIETVRVMSEAGIASFGTKKADQYDACMALIDRITARYNSDIESVRENGLPVSEDTSDVQNNVTDELDG